jgi:DNA mismatch endonuclease, patch repair protein
MHDHMTPQQRHECMSRIRSKDTRPEQVVRRELWQRGYRYRLNVRKLPGTPDIVLPKYRTVIFVNGCFWHGHKGCKHYTVPATNTEFWKAKVTRNQERDALNIQRLEAIAWNIITVWECELSKSNLPSTIDRMEAEITANKLKFESYTVHRRQDRRFALEQARKRREIAALVETELNLQFHIPNSVRKASYDSDEPFDIEE